MFLYIIEDLINRQHANIANNGLGDNLLAAAGLALRLADFLRQHHVHPVTRQNKAGGTGFGIDADGRGAHARPQDTGQEAGLARFQQACLGNRLTRRETPAYGPAG